MRALQRLEGFDKQRPLLAQRNPLIWLYFQAGWHAVGLVIGQIDAVALKVQPVGFCKQRALQLPATGTIG